ncbi:hypothetical protein [Campylobacter sp. RM16187]|uniref:hypothetical protein n=1 Tax=Campylobacter sp. RM16187 TaxID=1660063 RepID=UPI0021B5CC06|nr:hypothetical protein [Campylobacter sp. RM16187]QKG28769.1 hypothetical protein CDOMF_0487 [Campylobacter sp. RM16187]
MVSLLCHCCKPDYIYVPNFLLGRNAYVHQDECYFNNILYKRFIYPIGATIDKLATPTSPYWHSDYIYITCVFHRYIGDMNNLIDIPFPLSPYDYIIIDFLKPEYLGVNVGKHFNAYPDGVYDRLQFSWSDFTSDKISEVLDVLMNRFDSLFSPDYFYYSDDGYNINNYAVSYTYDEFLVALRAWLYRFFTDFFKRGCLSNFTSYTNLANKGQFMIEKEPK